MLKKDPNFHRLKVGGLGWGGSTSYWLGSDHLLVVEVVNYTERYRRFYFRDIQAIVIQQTKQQLWLSFAYGALVLLAMVIILSLVPPSGGWPVETAWGVGIVTFIALTLLAGMLHNTLKGRTCSVHIRTAVQTQKLRNVGRWRSAEMLVARLQPLVHASQGRGSATPPAAIPPGTAVGGEVSLESPPPAA